MKKAAIVALLLFLIGGSVMWIALSVRDYNRETSRLYSTHKPAPFQFKIPNATPMTPWTFGPPPPRGILPPMLPPFEHGFEHSPKQPDEHRLPLCPETDPCRLRMVLST